MIATGKPVTSRLATNQGQYMENRFSGKLFAKYPANLNGRDFVVADVHGCFDLLESLLKSIGFDFEKDRLFACGDLVDRGPRSLDALTWLLQPWFYSVRGNHDHYCVISGSDGYFLDHFEQGGEWFYELDSTQRNDVAFQFSRLPIAIEVEGRNGERYGIVHAECPYNDWDSFLLALSTRKDELELEGMIMNAIWSRGIISNDPMAKELLLFDYNKYPSNKNKNGVAGLDQMFVGHSSVEKIVQIENITYLDTGVNDNRGKLSVINMNTREIFETKYNPYYFKKNRSDVCADPWGR